MSWSLALHHGDFVYSRRSYATVTSQVKLVQDLRCWILEKMGTDFNHPEYGSTIDGGMKPDGTVVGSAVGAMDIDVAVTRIDTELRRIIRAYQAQQLLRAQGDQLTYGKTTFQAGELLLDIQDIKYAVDQDTLSIEITLVTADTTPIPLVITIPDGVLT